MNGKPWTWLEMDVLRRMYPDHSTRAVADLIGRPVDGVYRKAAEMGLTKSEAFNAGTLSGRIKRGRSDPRMVATQFQRGLTPWNKGKHVVAGGRSAETRFKKGRLPQEARNYCPIGSLRVNRDGHLEQKVTDDPSIYPARRWTPVYRLVWERAHGPIPEKHLVVFKPGMRTTVLELITVDRLECISKAENAARNHWRNKHPELAKLVQLKGAITRQVNRIVREANPS